MDNFFLNEIVAELSPTIVGRRLTRATLDGSELRFDFGGGRFSLVARLTGYDPALFLTSYKRRNRDSLVAPPQTEKTHSWSAQQFLLQVRSKLIGAEISAISKDPCDRIVSLTLNRTDAFGKHDSHLKMILSLTGRSANVLLVGQSGLIEAAFKEAGPIQIGGAPAPSRPAVFDPDTVLAFDAEQDVTSNEIIDSYFGRSSPFTNLYQREFLCRSNLESPAKALKSLVEDLFKNKRQPIIYSSFPLEEVAGCAMELGPQPGNAVIGRRLSGKSLAGVPSGSGGSEIILSCIELAFAKEMRRYEFPTFSEAAEVYSESIATARACRERYTRLTTALESKLKRLRAALRSIQADLARFSEAERFKRSGDLLLANLNDARIEGTIARVRDYYETDQPEIAIEIKEDQTLQQAAAAYYDKYQKARRAVKTLAPRAQEIGKHISTTEELLTTLLREPDLRRIEEAESLAGIGLPKSMAPPGSGAGNRGAPVKTSRTRRNRTPEIGRRFLSSDGYVIIVGRNDSENDAITFRVAGSLDIWLHAADYPGSHVVVRNPSRQPVPQRSIIEAAQIAAFYSQARRQGKTAVNYTQKKFVSKPPKAKPGLVRLSGYKTIVVEPRIPSALDETNQKP